VLRVADFGVFVDLGGLDGLIPASELSWGRFNHPREVVKVGQVIQGRIFRIERDNLRVALSIKQLSGDPWEQIENEIEIGKLVTGKVISEAPFGIFIELMPGIEALLHNSEIPEGTEKPKTGSTVTTKIIKIDLDQRKIGLSLRNVKLEDISVTDTSSESKGSELLVIEPKSNEPENLSEYNSTNGSSGTHEVSEQSEITN
jgi:ribosomal protein S1